jgi:hypothetical protein
MRRFEPASRPANGRQKPGHWSADAPQKRSGAVPNGSRKAHRELRLITSEALDGRTRVSQAFNQIIAQITADLGGELSEIEKHLVTSFAGATMLQSRQLTELLNGKSVDAHEYASVCAAMIRSATRLGTRRRQKDVTPDLDQYLRQREEAG